MTIGEQPGSEAPDPVLLQDFREFYRTTVQRTFRVAYRAAGGDKDVAHDATQEAYTVLLKCWLDNKKPEGDICRYAVGIAVHKVADFYRSKERERRVTAEEEYDYPGDESGYAEVLDTMTILPIVLAVLNRAPRRQREVGVLYFLEAFDYAEIADVLHIKRSDVRTHVQRLRGKLRPLINRITLDDQGGEQS